MKKLSMILLLGALIFPIMANAIGLSEKFQEISQELAQAALDAEKAIAEQIHINTQNVNSVKDLYNQFIFHARFQRDSFEQKASEILTEGLEKIVPTEAAVNALLGQNNIDASINIVETAYPKLREYAEDLKHQINQAIENLETFPWITDHDGSKISLKEALRKEQASHIKVIPTQPAEKEDIKKSMLSEFKRKFKSLSSEFLSVAKNDSKNKWETTKKVLKEALQDTITKYKEALTPTLPEEDNFEERLRESIGGYTGIIDEQAEKLGKKIGELIF